MNDPGGGAGRGAASSAVRLKNTHRAEEDSLLREEAVKAGLQEPQPQGSGRLPGSGTEVGAYPSVIRGFVWRLHG